jgi:hypothetical protein
VTRQQQAVFFISLWTRLALTDVPPPDRRSRFMSAAIRR